MLMKQLTLVFLRNEQLVLLAMKKRGFGIGKWNGVGGKVEPGETVQAAMVRECQEEIGVRVTDYEQVATILFNEYESTLLKQMQVHVFISTKWVSEPVESDEMRPEWFAMDELPFENMWADDSYWLPLVLKGDKLKAEFTLDEDNNVVDYSIKMVEKY